MPVHEVAPGLWRLPFTSSTLPPFDHTNGWLIAASERAVVVDPGFRDDAGLDLLDDALRAAGADRIEGVWLTHTHRDHREGLAGVLARWPSSTTAVHALEADRIDPDGPVRHVDDGTTLRVGDRRVDVLHTPGHSPGHLAFVVRDVGWMLVGDLLAGHGSVWVGAPEGDVRAYLASLDRVAAAKPETLGPGHGEPLRDPQEAIRRTREHRLERERKVLEALGAEREPATVAMLRGQVYPGLDPGLAALAERTLIAHLEKLVAEGSVERLGPADEGPYRAKGPR